MRLKFAIISESFELTDAAKAPVFFASILETRGLKEKMEGRIRVKERQNIFCFIFFLLFTPCIHARKVTGNKGNKIHIYNSFL